MPIRPSSTFAGQHSQQHKDVDAPWHKPTSQGNSIHHYSVWHRSASWFCCLVRHSLNVMKMLLPKFGQNQSRHNLKYLKLAAPPGLNHFPDAALHLHYLCHTKLPSQCQFCSAFVEAAPNPHCTTSVVDIPYCPCSWWNLMKIIISYSKFQIENKCPKLKTKSLLINKATSLKIILNYWQVSLRFPSKSCNQDCSAKTASSCPSNCVKQIPPLHMHFCSSNLQTLCRVCRAMARIC